MALNDPYKGLAVPHQLVAEFFAVFARCEYAMKETAYRRNDRGIAAPAWKQLAADAGGWLVIEPGSDLERATVLLTQDPPKLQTFSDGWRSLPLRGGNRTEQAVDAATRVRHNLFHGGKHTPEAYVGRDEQLVRAALVLLSAVIEQSPGDLKGAYNNG